MVMIMAHVVTRAQIHQIWQRERKHKNKLGGKGEKEEETTERITKKEAV